MLTLSPIGMIQLLAYLQRLPARVAEANRIVIPVYKVPLRIFLN